MFGKGQGALEYLLLIGGAILIAAVVLGVLTIMGSTGKQQSNQSLQKYAGTISSLELMAGKTFDAADPAYYVPNPSFWVTSNGQIGNGVAIGPCNGLGCLMTAWPGLVVEFNFPIIAGTPTKATFKVADYMDACNPALVHNLTFLVDGVEVGSWIGNSLNGKKEGGWAFPSIAFTPTNSTTKISIKINNDSYSRSTATGCYSDLNFYLDEITLETA